MNLSRIDMLPWAPVAGHVLSLSAALFVALGFATTRAAPLKVFILAGQSNMQGHAMTRTLKHLGMDPDTAPLLTELLDEKGDPVVCEDVWISCLSADGVKQGQLTAGFGANTEKIGPELAFGVTMRKASGEPILLIKTAWGGKSLHTDFRPPGAGPYELPEQTRKLWEQHPQGAHGVPKAEDRPKWHADKAAQTGVCYRQMIAHVKQVLADPGKVCPAYDPEQGFELAGFVWFQGWNDMVDRSAYPARDQPGGYDAYSRVLADFIRDVRRDLEAPAMPFVIGVMGVGGPVAGYGPDERRYAKTHQNFRDAMAAPAKLPEFQGNVTAVLTENCWDPQLQALNTRDRKVRQEARKIRKEKGLQGREAEALLDELRAAEFSQKEREIVEAGISNQAYHYLGSGKIMARIGKAFAEALIGTPPATATKAPAPGAATEAQPKEQPEAGRSGRAWTQDSSSRQLWGELVKVEGEGRDETVTIRSGDRLIAIPLHVLDAEDRIYVAR